ncbi:MAG: family 78 glycoside hydrolase catalytic domain [Pirellulaceae bacterium]
MAMRCLRVILGFVRPWPLGILLLLECLPWAYANVAAAAVDDPPVHVQDLTCEYLPDPAGIDVARPRLSWVLRSPLHNQRQTAYRVLVASTREQSHQQIGDLWDSGKVASDQSVFIEYGGTPLVSHQQCFWTVMTWNQDDQPSNWSDVAKWSMGILAPEEWGAQWIGFSKAMTRQIPTGQPAAELSLQDVSWIWGGDKQARVVVPQGVCYLRRALELPPDTYVKWAYIAMAADDQFRLWINGNQASVSSPAADASQHITELELTERLRPGRNVIAIDATNVADGPAGFAAKVIVVLGNDQKVVLATDAQWKASLTGGSNWQSPDFDDANWDAAVEVATVGAPPLPTPRAGHALGWSQAAPSPVLRKNFSVPKPVRRAMLYVCGLGYHEPYLNGTKVGDHVLDPAFTRYDRRALYVTHDVSQLVHEGQNTLGVMLGNGWYNMHTRATWNFDQAPWRGEPRALVQLRIEHEDGSVSTVVSDSSWRASTGPVRLDGIRAGEFYDACQEMPGWSTSEFDDTAWEPPTVLNPPGGVLSAQMMPPIRVCRTLNPVSVQEPRPGVFVFDLGQNIAGWAQLHVKGPQGTQVTMRYGECVDAQGMIERGAIDVYVFEGGFQTDNYILKGEGDEIWEPRFTYHGFRYVEVTGYPGKPALSSLRGRVVHTDFQDAGSFACSDSLLTSIQQLTLASYRNNFHGYPTDCPQREKNGWTGDAHLAAEQAMYNFQNASSYAKWIQDIHDEQRESGAVPAIVPTAGWGYAWGNGPAWDSALVLIPWYLYTYCGDERILSDHYDAMKKYVDYVQQKSENLIADFGLGDWVPAKTETPRNITSTGYFYRDAAIVAETARILGKETDAQHYAQLAVQVRDAFNKTFCKSDGSIGNNSQAALSCGLYQGLVPDEQIPQVLNKLVESVRAGNDHLDVGILGAKYLFHALSDHGQHALAFRIATQTTPPSYGDWVSRGATTLWEDWPGVGSLNHIMFGDISAWFYQELAGIHADASQPGFKHFIVRPRLVPGLSWASAEHASPYGRISVRWDRDESGVLTMNVQVPVNTTATIHIPADDPEQVLLYAVASDANRTLRPLDDATMTRDRLTDKPAAAEPGYRSVLVGSGAYRFIAK